MTHPERRLLRHLVIAVVAKLLLLTLLWWTFVRDARVDADIESTAAHVAAPRPTQGVAP